MGIDTGLDTGLDLSLMRGFICIAQIRGWMIPIMLEHCLINENIFLNIIRLLRYGVGASRDPCSEVFQGPHPFSERESRALRLRDIHVCVYTCIL